MTTGATATIRGGFWEVNGVLSLPSISGKSPLRRIVALAFDSYSLMDQRAISVALDGVVPGSNATKTLGRIENNTELGGKRVIETNTLVNRNTTAGDVTEHNADFFTLTTRTTKGANPPANKDQNPLGTR